MYVFVFLFRFTEQVTTLNSGTTIIGKYLPSLPFGGDRDTRLYKTPNIYAYQANMVYKVILDFHCLNS